MRVRHSLAVLLFAGALAPSVAHAEVSDGDKATARQLAIDGYDALKKSDYAGAAERFKRADSLYHAPTITLGLARAQAGLGKLVAAQELYSRVVHEPLPPNASAGVTKAVEDAKRELEALSPRVPSVVINVNGGDAPKVTLDGTEVAAAALGVKRPAEPGKHVIRATAAGFAPGEATVNLLEGKNESITIELKPGQDASALPVVAAAPGVTPPLVEPGEPTPVIGSARPAVPASDHVETKSSMQKTLGVIVLGVGAAGLIVGGVTGGLALGKHGDILKSCPEGHCSPDQKASVQPAIDSYNSMGAISTIGFIAGGALAATGVVLMLTAPRAKVEQAAIMPVLGFGFVGANGSF
jgi:hypothetical protein